MLENPSTGVSRPWWYAAPGQRSVFVYLLLIHLLSVIGLVAFPIPGLTVFLVAFGFAALGSLGTTVALHRALSHRALNLNPIVEQILILFAAFNGSGHPIRWVPNHRRHHANADTPEDISSPRYGGFWWAHLVCLYQLPDTPSQHWAPDLEKRRYTIWARIHPIVLLLSLTIGCGLGWAGFFWIGPLRLVYSLHAQCFVNSMMHMAPKTGGGADDGSLNLWWFGPFQLLSWGENWHRNHHAEPGAARMGRTWYQTDLGWYTIWALEKLGLAWDVERDRGGAVQNPS